MTSKKDYIAISNCIRNCTSGHNTINKGLLISALANYFKENERFDSSRFARACYAEKEIEKALRG